MGLGELVDNLRGQVINPKARSAILSCGSPDESSLLGTRDGLLNFALAILRFVDSSDHFLANGRVAEDIHLKESPEQQALWSDIVKHTLHQLPGINTYLVGCYFFSNYRRFAQFLDEALAPDLARGESIEHDPDFRQFLDHTPSDTEIFIRKDQGNLARPDTEKGGKGEIEEAS